ncbi:MAG: hemerythrin family protein [Candidatus Omnitrophica bacterium]|nr:hemerythrin family protein [Candidatus Omnitrophota bacterium]MDE2010388.1 hemerythrin family protein [Candidatus Omnitrophota bacterium]MDE2214774.1 hemerythrin family protein [Candidatus Omnitrophota bacterium]MDE2231443.1 hemerythrin family protein [Candidatus Omnitrophota bacterium]
MIEWQDAYSTGIVKLDKQHQNLFRFSNDLEERINCGVVSKQTVDGALQFLGNYIKGHFGQEETCMHRYVCPVAEKNTIAHQEFIKEFGIFQNTISKDGDNERPLRELHLFLQGWLVDHICKIDLQLKPCVEKSR